jgi:hypothetical protein
LYVAVVIGDMVAGDGDTVAGDGDTVAVDIMKITVKVLPSSINLDYTPSWHFMEENRQGVN